MDFIAIIQGLDRLRVSIAKALTEGNLEFLNENYSKIHQWVSSELGRLAGQALAGEVQLNWQWLESPEGKKALNQYISDWQEWARGIKH